MKFLGNVVCEVKFEGNNFLNVVNNINDIDRNLPTLIIGLQLVKKLYPSFSILDWKINDMVYWTFDSREKRNYFERDLDRFNKLIIDNTIKTVHYSFENILTMCDDDKKALFNELKSVYPKSSYINKDVLYVFSSKSNEVYGISLNDVEYGGGNKFKLINLVLKNENIFKVRDVNSDIRNIFKNNMYIIPFIYS